MPTRVEGTDKSTDKWHKNILPNSTKNLFGRRVTDKTDVEDRLAGLNPSTLSTFDYEAAGLSQPPEKKSVEYRGELYLMHEERKEDGNPLLKPFVGTGTRKVFEPDVKKRNETLEEQQEKFGYNTQDQASMAKFMKQKLKAGEVYKRGGHHFFLDHRRSSFIVVPKGDYKDLSQIRSFKAFYLRGDKAGSGLEDSKHMDRAVEAFLVAYNQIQEGDEGGLELFTLITIDFKNKKVHGYINPDPDLSLTSCMTGKYIKLKDSTWKEIGKICKTNDDDKGPDRKKVEQAKDPGEDDDDSLSATSHLDDGPPPPPPPGDDDGAFRLPPVDLPPRPDIWAQQDNGERPSRVDTPPLPPGEQRTTLPVFDPELWDDGAGVGNPDN